MKGMQQGFPNWSAWAHPREFMTRFESQTYNKFVETKIYVV